MKRIGVAILGGTGYGAGELLRLLTAHPEVDIVSVTSRSSVGVRAVSVHTHLEGLFDIEFTELPDLEKLSTYEHPVIIAALPHGASSRAVAALLEQPLPERTKVIDLSGDLRLEDPELHAAFYPDVDFAPEIRRRFLYGLPELGREEIRAASRVANPGCLATAGALALLPIAREQMEGSVIIDAKTGTSGAGRSPQASMHHPGRHANFEAYKALVHRHEPEIRQALGDAKGEKLRTMFVPHLLPISRGIFVTAYMTLSSAEVPVEERYRSYYSVMPFVRIREGSPRLSDVIGTNFCDISVTVRDRQIVIMAALDNLVKGMAGQAVQNMNLMCGVDERVGLMTPSLGIG